MNKKLLTNIGPLIGTIIFSVALYVLYKELEEYHINDIFQSLERIPKINIIFAILLTFLNYLVLTGYDALALRYIRHSLSYPRIILASFIGYAFSNNIGLSMIAGSSVRYRLYTAWGLSALEITKVVAFYTLTLWLGLCAVAGATFLVQSSSLPAAVHLSSYTVRVLGLALILLPLLYLVATSWHTGPYKLFHMEFSPPSLGLSFSQIILSAVDWTLAATILFVLLPAESSISYPLFLSIYLLAQISGLLSQVPGGLGVFESVLVIGLSPFVPSDMLMGTLLGYRFVYYLVPFVLALLFLGAYEFAAKETWVVRAGRTVGKALPDLVPPAFALMVFAGGAILIYSGATPAEGWRLALLKTILPLPAIEASHLMGSLIGACLLLLARGLQLRLDAAHLLTSILLSFGIVASLVKGLDFEEAAILGIMLAILLPCRKNFYRKASLMTEYFSAGWIASISLVLLSSVWLVLFAYKHIEYAHELWWSFAFSDHAPRSLRGTLGAAVVCLVFSAVRLLRPAAPPDESPSKQDRETVANIVADSPFVSANLALLGDKRFLFSDSRKAFIMYGVEGRSWVAMGDPVGPAEECADLLWRFHEMSHRYGGWTAFYEVGTEHLPLYLDLGLSLLKMGEEARVPLANFSLEGKSRKSFRHIRNRFEKEGHEFEIYPPEQFASFLPRLKAVSDAWLASKKTREKRFSLGCFNTSYLQGYPFAVVQRGEEVLAFANLWLGAEKEELSVDLMRYLPHAPPDTMEYLFLRLMLWGKDQGYRWFNLGMAPLAGLENRATASMWSRLGAFIYSHSDHFYNFQGLRQYKEKFDPIWEPRYLACPDGMVLPRVLANIASLVSGGMKGVVVK